MTKRRPPEDRERSVGHYRSCIFFLPDCAALKDHLLCIGEFCGYLKGTGSGMEVIDNLLQVWYQTCLAKRVGMRAEEEARIALRYPYTRGKEGDRRI